MAQPVSPVKNRETLELEPEDELRDDRERIENVECVEKSGIIVIGTKPFAKAAKAKDDDHSV